MKLHDAVLTKDIEYYDGDNIIVVKKDTIIKVDLEYFIALVNDIHINIEENEFKLFD